MSLLLVQPLLAVNDPVFAAILVIISIVGWLYRFVQNQNQKVLPPANRPRPPAPPRPREGRLQEEIETFIQEVNQKKGARRPPTAPPRPTAASAKTPSKPPARRLQPQPAAPTGASSGDSSSSWRAKPGQEIASRHISAGKEMGAGVQKHVQQAMRDRVAQEVAVFLAPSVDQSVSAHLGQAVAPSAAAAAPAAAKPSARVHPLAEAFRSPQGVRQAIVMNLILSPPPGRKRPGSSTS